MVRVDRNSVAVPASISIAGVNETSRASIFYSIPANSNLPLNPPYSAYKAKDIRLALTTLFNGKCSYCDSNMVVVTTGDIEHFRPKAGVGKDKNALIKPGYYWLATDWDNLLLSCANCNRENTFEIVNVGTLTVGKANQFPLSSGERHRLKGPTGNFSKEDSVRLLLNPCIDHPEQHLRYNDKGWVLAKKKKGNFSKKGLTSIDVFALQRKDLVDARETLIIEIKAQMKTVERCVLLQNKIGKGVDPATDQWVIDELTRLKKFLNPKAEYLAVARQYIRPFLLKMLGIRI